MTCKETTPTFTNEICLLNLVVVSILTDAVLVKQPVPVRVLGLVIVVVWPAVFIHHKCRLGHLAVHHRHRSLLLPLLVPPKLIPSQQLGGDVEIDEELCFIILQPRRERSRKRKSENSLNLGNKCITSKTFLEVLQSETAKKEAEKQENEEENNEKAQKPKESNKSK